MSRKDYELIAATLSTAMVERAWATAAPDATFAALSDVARKLADSFAIDNPAFQRRRFLAACGVGV